MSRDSRSVHQFRALRALEEAFAADSSATDAAVGRLAEGLNVNQPTVTGVEAALAADGAAEPLAHLRDHWLSGAYWPNIDGATIVSRLESGFRSAAEDAAAEGLALVPIWVCATDDHEADTFRVDHVVTATAVVVTIITPRPNR